MAKLKRKPQRRIADFGRLVRNRRERLGMTLNELARQALIDQALLSKIERGKRPPPQLVPHVQRIASALRFPNDSPEFKELFETAYRERFGKTGSWPSIVAIVSGEHGEPVLVRRPLVPTGLGDYAPPETREIIPRDSPLGREFRSDEEIQRAWGPPFLGGSPIFTPEAAIPSSLREILSKTTAGFWLQQMIVGLVHLGVTLTQFTRQGDCFTLDLRLPDGREYAMSVAPKGNPNRPEKAGV